MSTDRRFGFRTRALHAGTPPNATSGATSPPIELSTGFVFDSTAQAKELFSLRTYGNIYTRISNPTVGSFEEKVANLEGGLGAVAASSGQAAQMVAILSLAQSGDHLVASANIYGGTVTQLNVSLRRLGIETTFVPGGAPEAMAAAIRPNTKALFVETIGNPAGTIADLTALAAVAHDAGLPLVVDNTFATPYLCRPIEHGADIVLHSATKYLCGHGTVVAGVLVESGKFDWGRGKHPLLSEPSPSYHHVRFTDTFSEYAFLTRARAEVMRDLGACLSPMNAWLLVQGVETLPVRMDGHVRNAMRIAEFLERHRGKSWVSYP
ncbi:MAG TPA: aminotransferase class V-fold PLP-dependent enzyme, partial [Candidatus Acidoferrales bacterium]|nr:aminotransferase class V-fold PLP-dependent enzyme [Candidatus Acidoferrales bacterium]